MGSFTLASNNKQCTPENKANLLCSNTPPDKGSDIFGSIAVGVFALVLVIMIGILIKNPELFEKTKTMHTGSSPAK